MSALDLAAWVLIALAVFDWFATSQLISAALYVKEPALEERATVSVILSVAATVGAVIAAAYLLDLGLVRLFSTSLLVVAFLLVSVPQIVWYVAFRVGRFR